MTTATLGPVELSGAFRATTTGGWNAPSQTVDRNFDWQTYSNRKPIELTFEAVVTSDELTALQDLRDDTSEPFPASVGSFEIPEAQLPDLQVEEEATRKSHVRVTGTVKEVFQAGVETTEFVVQVPSGGAQSGSDSGGGSGSSSAGIVDSSGDDTGETESSAPDDISTVAGMRQATPGPWV